MAHFEVSITDDERAEIGGQPLLPEPCQSVHDAVLDRLHQYALQRAAAVEATVNDSSGTADFVLQVSPDGSSRVLYPGHTPESREPERAPVSADATAVTAVSAVATAIARARAMTPAVTTGPPAEYAQRISRIEALATGGRLDEAYADASALREHLTGSLGSDHPHALEARSMEAYLAHLCGHHREATVLALGVARIRCGAGDRRAAAEVARAAAAWQRIDDDRAALVHGLELLHMWEQLELLGQLPPGDGALVGQVRRHVDALASYV